MIDDTISKRVVQIGPVFRPPHGGIAQVLHTYDTLIFKHMDFIANSSKGKLRNLYVLCKSLIKLFFKLMTDSDKRIVHIHSASKASFLRSTIYARLAKLMRRRVMMHIHGGGFKIYYDKDSSTKHFVKRELERCDTVVVLTDGWLELLRADLEIDNLVCIHNPIAQSEFKSVVADGRVHILFMGLIIESKGIFDLVRAIADVNEDQRHRFVLHVGGSGDVERLMDFITDNQLEDTIVFEGWVTGERKLTLMNQCEILVQPSYVEALSLSILEGMSYRMAILATNVGGIPTIVANDENGFLVSPGDIPAMRLRLEQLVASSDLRQRMGEESFKRVKPFMPDNVAGELAKLYAKLD